MFIIISNSLQKFSKSIKNGIFNESSYDKATLAILPSQIDADILEFNQNV